MPAYINLYFFKAIGAPPDFNITTVTFTGTVFTPGSKEQFKARVNRSAPILEERVEPILISLIVPGRRKIT